jgi:hypothetical protein
MINSYVNLTPHEIRLNDGRVFPPAGVVARVSTSHTPFDENGVCAVQFGEIVGLPAPQDGILYIVSGMVAAAAKRNDVVSPATGHPDAKRDERGQIISVPGFVCV